MNQQLKDCADYMDDQDKRIKELEAQRNELVAACRWFIQLSNKLACALTPEQISQATVALTTHCHDARTAIIHAEGKP